MKSADYDYNLPEELIAQRPSEVRGGSRLLVVGKSVLDDKNFRDLPDLIDSNSFLVLNDSRVVAARISARKKSGGEREVFFLTPVDKYSFIALVRGKLKAGDTLYAMECALEAVIQNTDGSWLIRSEVPFEEVLERCGEIPLPPYIRRKADREDKERYQTVYANKKGSVAAPTAGLHFTEELLAELEKRGVSLIRLSLHVGIGTFRPIKVDDLSEHKMHSESYFISEESAGHIEALKQAGKKLIAVGTTTVRALESAVGSDGKIRAGEGKTELFIAPGYRFKLVDGLITNFHLPKSSLMVMVAALMGRERLLDSYAHAVDKGYRFYSYGDAMFITDNFVR